MGNGSRPHRPGSKDPGQYAPKLPPAGVCVPGIVKPNNTKGKAK